MLCQTVAAIVPQGAVFCPFHALLNRDAPSPSFAHHGTRHRQYLAAGRGCRGACHAAVEDQVQEFVAHSWYDYSAGKDKGLHPYQGETTLNYTGPKPPYQHLDTDASYSWLKSPRWKGKAVEHAGLVRPAFDQHQGG
ncbi:MAG: nickel-dependent hydrogenase large subunit [Sulfurimicrobium sp.]|nr:nickel-dependent hydrogenase large subunit [Sulfurimicrobium sp.]